MAIKFKQPVSMQVTWEQFYKDLKQPLIDLGYEITSINNFSKNSKLVTNYTTRPHLVSNIATNDNHYDRHFIDHYNPELFLAIAAMTEGNLPSVGEYWKFKKDVYSIKEIEGHHATIVGAISKIPLQHTIHLFEDICWKKLTLEELVKHFTKKPIVPEKEIIGYELIKPEYEKVAIQALKIPNKTAYKPFIVTAMIAYYLPKIKELGIESWFEPVYKKEDPSIYIKHVGEFKVKDNKIYHNDNDVTYAINILHTYFFQMLDVQDYEKWDNLINLIKS